MLLTSQPTNCWPQIPTTRPLAVEIVFIMKVIALLSGGKDSVATMMEAVRLGHCIVATANLLPLDSTVADVDSFMFQTAAHGLIESLAQCMPSVPMYRRRLMGSSQSVEMQYAQDEHDEVEDLYALLAHIQKQHPEANAVCSGAILSNYQRMRVEMVCGRLGFTSLAYLWEREQTDLLTEMIERNVHAVLVKVASMGLMPAKHLGKSLAEMLPLLKKLEGDFGCSVCGEGGEYETFVLDCPLFENRIELLECNPRALSSDPIAPVGLLDIKQSQVVCKKTAAIVAPSSKMIYYVEDTSTWKEVAIPDVESSLRDLVTVNETRSSATDRFWGVSLRVENAEHPNAFKALCQTLAQHKPAFVSVRTHDMATFSSFNLVYSRYFPLSPPSRAVWQPENQGRSIVVDMVCGANGQFKSHHVQSISCWAPACIGPYSQAASLNGLCFISGQIALVPDTMVLAEKDSVESCHIHACAVAKSQSAVIVYCNVFHVDEDAPDLTSIPNSVLCLPVRVAALPRGAKFELVAIAEIGSASSFQKRLVFESELILVHVSESSEKKLTFCAAHLKTHDAEFDLATYFPDIESVVYERRYPGGRIECCFY